MALSDKKITFKGGLLMLILLVLMPFVVLQVYSYRESFNRRYRQELRTNREVAKASAKSFKQLVASMLHELTVIGHFLVISQSSVADIERIFAEMRRDHPFVRNFSLITPEGVVRTSDLPAAVGLDVTAKSYFTILKNGADWHISGLHRSLISGDLIFSVSRAVRDAAGALQAIIVANITEKALAREFLFQRGGDAGIFLVDGTGRLVASVPEMALSWEQRNFLDMDPGVRQALGGEEYMGSSFWSLSGEEMVVAHVPLSFGWVVCAGRSKAQALAPIYADLRKRVLLFGVCLGAALILPLLFARRLAGAVAKLRSFADAVGRGEYERTGGTFGVFEFQYLADTFHRMARQVEMREEALLQARQELHQANAQLECRVRERTELLESAYAQLDSRAAKLRALANELVNLEQGVRKQVAKTLHDHLQQILVAMKMRIEALGQADSADFRLELPALGDLLKEAIQITRSITLQLSPPILSASLPEALRWLVKWMKKQHGFSFELEVVEGLPRLPKEIRFFLFEAARELLFNTVKHAGVQTARVKLRPSGPRGVCLEVTDDGRGFDPQRLQTAEECQGFGLFSVIERIQLFDGAIGILSTPGHGAHFAITIPVAEAKGADGCYDGDWKTSPEAFHASGPPEPTA